VRLALPYQCRMRAHVALRRRQAGFTYLAVLLLVALVGLGLAASANLVATAMQREQELELLFIGNQYRLAIGSYYESTPGSVKQFPMTLEAMLKDDRHPVTVRHLRKLYNDPMTGKADWVLVTRADGRIAGIASRSKKAPLKQDNFSNPLDRDFRASIMLSEWKFIYSPALVAVPGAPGAAPPPFPETPAPGSPPAFGTGFSPAFGSAPSTPPSPVSPASPFLQPEPDARSRR
jgi:type II secretory pathway pseudopilin PulG